MNEEDASLWFSSKEGSRTIDGLDFWSQWQMTNDKPLPSPMIEFKLTWKWQAKTFFDFRQKEEIFQFHSSPGPREHLHFIFDSGTHFLPIDGYFYIISITITLVPSSGNMLMQVGFLLPPVVESMEMGTAANSGLVRSPVAVMEYWTLRGKKGLCMYYKYGLADGWGIGSKNLLMKKAYYEHEFQQRLWISNFWL